MDKVYEIIKSPEWWITVVIAGICINLISVYLRNVLETRFVRVSRLWDSRTKEKRKQKEDYIARLKSDEKFFALNSLRHTKYRTWAINWNLMGVLCFLVSQITVDVEKISIIFMALGAIAFFRGFQNLLKADRCANYAEESVTNNDT